MLTITRTRAWVRCAFRAMGSPCELLLDGTPAHIDLAVTELRRLETCWTRFDPASELARLNAAAGTWFAVSDDLFSIVARSAVEWERTGGAFDPTILPSLVTLGYGTTFTSVAADGDAVQLTGPAVGFAGVDLDSVGKNIRLPKGTAIDLGGIGKGLAADRVATLLLDAGARAVCISLGGDLHAAGEPPEFGRWELPVAHPITGVEFTVPLAKGGLVTSTSLLRTWRRGGVRFHHVIDPLTGDSTRSDVDAAIVNHASTATAEVLAKAAMVLGASRGAALLSANNAGGWFLADNELVPVAPTSLRGSRPRTPSTSGSLAVARPHDRSPIGSRSKVRA